MGKKTGTNQNGKREIDNLFIYLIFFAVVEHNFRFSQQQKKSTDILEKINMIINVIVNKMERNAMNMLFLFYVPFLPPPPPLHLPIFLSAIFCVLRVN